MNMQYREIELVDGGPSDQIPTCVYAEDAHVETGDKAPTSVAMHEERNIGKILKNLRNLSMKVPDGGTSDPVPTCMAGILLQCRVEPREHTPKLETREKVPTCTNLQHTAVVNEEPSYMFKPAQSLQHPHTIQPTKKIPT